MEVNSHSPKGKQCCKTIRSSASWVCVKMRGPPKRWVTFRFPRHPTPKSSMEYRPKHPPIGDRWHRRNLECRAARMPGVQVVLPEHRENRESDATSHFPLVLEAHFLCLGRNLAQKRTSTALSFALTLACARCQKQLIARRKQQENRKQLALGFQDTKT